MSSVVSAVPTLDPQRCQFFFADGRRCRTSRWQAHPALCFTHARKQAGPYPQSDPHSDVAVDLAPLSGEFRTATEINRALGKVFLLLAQNRMNRRNAVALGYLSQLLLQTLPGVREEHTHCLGRESWNETLNSVFPEEDDSGLEDNENNDASDLAAESALVEAQTEDNADGAAKSENGREAYLGTPISRLAPSPYGTSAEPNGPAPVHTEAAPDPEPDFAPIDELLVNKEQGLVGCTGSPREKTPDAARSPQEEAPSCIYYGPRGSGVSRAARVARARRFGHIGFGVSGLGEGGTRDACETEPLESASPRNFWEQSEATERFPRKGA
jgi:hypothetical protein